MPEQNEAKFNTTDKKATMPGMTTRMTNKVINNMPSANNAKFHQLLSATTTMLYTVQFWEYHNKHVNIFTDAEKNCMWIRSEPWIYKLARNTFFPY